MDRNETIGVKTTLANGRVEQTIDGLTKRVVDIAAQHQDAAVRAALTQLGWTPPEESEELRRDAERLDFLERLADDGYAPRIVYDDDWRWALSDAGSQPVAPDGGHTEMVAITSFVEPEQWKPSIRAAIDSARGAE